MKTNTLILTLAFFVAISSNAQTELFKVLAAKGQNTFKRSNSNDWRPLVAGTKLGADDQIKVGANCYLGLVHAPTGKTMEVKETGTYEVKEMAKKITATKTSFSQKYLDYVASELTEGDKQDVNKNHRSNSKVTGSVERAISGPQVKVFMPKNSDIAENTVKLVWISHKEANSYVVTVNNMFEEQVMKFETKDTTAIVDFSKLDLGDDKSIIWNVAVKGKEKIKSEDHKVRLIESKDLNNKIAELKSETSEETALNQLIRAIFYSQNEMFNEAKASYETAIKLAPEVSEFKRMYKSYLESHNLGELYNF
ncbi:MAG: hypothetical protein SNJ77_07890 [Cytophagales bacterium]